MIEYWEKSVLLENLVKDGTITLDRGRVISSIDLMKYPGDYPVYSSSVQKNGYFGSFDLFDFDEELITWSVDGGGYFFYRPKHRFSVTNVSGILRITKSGKYDYKFLYYLLAFQHKNQIFDYVDKAHPSVIKKRYFIPEIGVTEQTTIARILSKVDEAIAQTEQLIAKYTRIKTGLMQDLLTKGIDEHGNIRSEETHEFKDSPLGRIPKEWECELLGNNNIELHNNKRKPISAKERANMIGDYPYYGATGIIDMLNVYKLDGEFVLFGEDGDHFLKWVYQEQTILTNGKFNVSNHAHIVKGTSKCSTKWIHYFFCHRDITYYLTRQGAGRFKLNKASLLSLPILIPKSKDEQEAIIQRIEKLNEYSDELKNKFSKLQSLKTGLMQDLLSGKVRVNHLIKETASV
jgi:type I restriction enzyme S subunit